MQDYLSQGRRQRKIMTNTVICRKEVIYIHTEAETTSETTEFIQGPRQV